MSNSAENINTENTDVKQSSAKCTLGWHDGSCCCNCHHQLELHKHPSNSTFGRGSISEGCGWVCTLPEYGGFGIYMDTQHGMCECHTPLT